jgi:hypothetical protein
MSSSRFLTSNSAFRASLHKLAKPLFTCSMRYGKPRMCLLLAQNRSALMHCCEKHGMKRPVPLLSLVICLINWDKDSCASACNWSRDCQCPCRDFGKA